MNKPEINDAAERASGSLERMVGRDGQNPKINPEYLKATHLVLCIYPGAPSFEEQIRHDQEVQEQLEKELRDSSNQHADPP